MSFTKKTTNCNSKGSIEQEVAFDPIFRSRSSENNSSSEETGQEEELDPNG